MPVLGSLHCKFRKDIFHNATTTSHHDPSSYNILILLLVIITAAATLFPVTTGCLTKRLLLEKCRQSRCLRRSAANCNNHDRCLVPDVSGHVSDIGTRFYVGWTYEATPTAALAGAGRKTDSIGGGGSGGCAAGGGSSGNGAAGWWRWWGFSSLFDPTE